LGKNGRMLVAFNIKFISLIRKLENQMNFDKFRAISLCDYIYKIIAKIIGLRVKVLLYDSISFEEFAFLSSKQIHEAIGVAQEGLHSIKTKKTLSMLLKIDLQKIMIGPISYI
jgi:hypothetical protein